MQEPAHIEQPVQGHCHLLFIIDCQTTTHMLIDMSRLPNTSQLEALGFPLCCTEELSRHNVLQCDAMGHICTWG